jgi:hypothetical protein
LDANLNLFRSLDRFRAYWTQKRPGMNEISVPPL